MNKKTILFASLLLGGLPLMGTLSADAAVRDTISINQGWQFHRGDVKNIAELKSTQSISVQIGRTSILPSQMISINSYGIHP